MPTANLLAPSLSRDFLLPHGACDGDADLSEAAAETQAAVRSAIPYPAAVAGLAASAMLIVVVLPRFANTLADVGQTLPASTELVLHIALVARAALVPVLVAFVIALALWRSWAQTNTGRAQWHGVLLAIPVVGSLRRDAASARMAHSLAALLDSGAPVASAMSHVASASGDAALALRLMDASVRVVAGQSLSDALEASRAASDTTIRLARVGEQSGCLPSMLRHAAKCDQHRVDHAVGSAVRMLEPILLLTVASVGALVAAALLQAIDSGRPAA